MNTCTDPFCRQDVDPDYGDMCKLHGSGRAWMRRALDREAIEREREAEAVPTPNDYCQPGYCTVPGHPAEHNDGDKLEVDIPAVYEAGLRKEN